MNERFQGMSGYDCGCGSRQGDGGRRNLMRKVQEYNFMMIEAGLFLNNQPECCEAQETFCEYQKRYLQAVKEYEDCYGPLTYAGINVKNDGWSWINSPWPWEAEGC